MLLFPVHTDVSVLAGNIVIVMSTEAGVISGVLPSSERWRINLHDLGNNMVN